MKKEVILAIIIGLIFGLVITFGIYQANHYAKPKNNSEQNNVTPTPTPTQENSLILLDYPSDGDIFQDSSATISGSVKSGVILTLLTEDDERFIITQNNRFNEEITLNTGANLIELIAISPEGQRQEIKLNLVYTTADLEK